MERMFIAAALSGTRTERKATISRSTDSATTMPMNSGSFERTTESKSEMPAVAPPTAISAFEARSSGGRASSRSSVSSVFVRSDCGEESG